MIGYPYEEEMKRLRQFRQNYDAAILTEIQSAAPTSIVRRADPMPTYPGNRQQRRKAAAKARKEAQ